MSRYYRLMVLPLRLPPLRAREGDIERLARYFLDLLNEQILAEDLAGSGRGGEVHIVANLKRNVRTLN